ncbi:hypothetical protein N0V82_008963 [Gnomoniopsis sp. IMI 355080]|nr:hypothetical protein N0V82_008963 [Gnomoniopsis sp. IMI 355080]
MSTQAPGCYNTQVDFLSPSDSDSDPAVPATQTFTALTNQSALKRWAPNFSHYGGQVQTIPGALKEPCIPFVYNMMGQLFTIHRRDEVNFTAPWFDTMLNYLGTTSVLDSAMCAFMLQLVGKAKRDVSDVNRSRDIYGQSLGALQRALNHPVAWKSTETLAATILCSLFEVTKAIFAGHDCFLNQPKWKRLCQDLNVETTVDRPGTSGMFKESAPLTSKRMNDHFILQAQLPPIIRMGYNIRQGRNNGVEPDPEQVARLRPKAEELRVAFLSWHADYASEGALADPIEVPSADPTSPYKTVLQYRNPWEGTFIMSYWTSLLILQESLNQCHPGPGLLFTNNQELAHNILRSIEHVGRGLMGPHRVGYPLRVAYDFVDVDTQAWALSKVSGYNDTYAAMSADVYPANPLFDLQSSSQVERVESQPLSWIE